MECLSLVVARPAPSPSCPSGKATEVLRKAGTRDAGPCGPAGPWQGRPSVQLPAGIERRARFIAGFRAKARVGARKSGQQELSDDAQRYRPCGTRAPRLAAVNIKEIFT